MQGLEGAGWSVGRNLRIDMRWGGEVDRIRRSAMELVALTPDVRALAPTQLWHCNRRLALCRYVRDHRDFLHLT